MPDNKRLKNLITWLISQSVVESQEDLACKLGYNASFISQVVIGNKPLSEKLRAKITGLSNKINPNYLFGEDPMVLQEAKADLAYGVPYYDIDVTATITESFSDVKENPEFYVDFRPFNDCTAYLPIFGHSMFPAYASGEIIAVKHLPNPEYILWGEAYLIITDASTNNMRTVKLLFQHEDQDKVILRASNPNFKGDTVIPKSSIVNLYAVKGKITRNQI